MQSDYPEMAATQAPALDIATDRAQSIVGIQTDTLNCLQQFEAMLFGDQPVNPSSHGLDAKAPQQPGKLGNLMHAIDAGQNQAQTIRDVVQNLMSRL